MKKIEIFDPAMCCSAGVCGPSLRIATFINRLKEKGIIIKRHCLSTEPQDFISNKVISDILQKERVGILPVTLVDGKVAKTKEYPTNEELSGWLGVKSNPKEPEQEGDWGCGMEGCGKD